MAGPDKPTRMFQLYLSCYLENFRLRTVYMEIAAAHFKGDRFPGTPVPRHRLVSGGLRDFRPFIDHDGLGFTLDDTFIDYDLGNIFE